MVEDGRYTAVLDRFEDDLAVLLLEDGDEVVDDLVVDRERLPSPARHQDAVLTVVVRDGDLADATYDPETTERRSERARDRFDRLSRRPPDEDG